MSSNLGRVASLDGLRGVAALVVVFHHAMLTWPLLAEAVDGRGRAVSFSWEWWLTYSPLHTFWLGTEAVYVFFILSGFVLTGPALKSGFAWTAYYRKRIARLYLPVFGSLLFAALAVVVVPRTVTAGLSSWTNGHQGVSVTDALAEATLLIPVQDHLNGPLWSLTWEVWFSLLLPVYLIVARWTTGSKGRALLATGALFCIMALSPFTTGAFRFLPMFALGVLMFVHQAELKSIGRWLDGPRGAWVAVAVVAVLLLTSYWMLQAIDAIPRPIISAFRLAQIAGAVLIVFVALCWGPAKRALNTRALQWLGSRSFSLYLIHDPIVSTAAFILGPGVSPFLVLAITLPAGLAVAEIFFRLIERPSHMFAAWIGGSRSTRAPSLSPAGQVLP